MNFPAGNKNEISRTDDPTRRAEIYENADPTRPVDISDGDEMSEGGKVWGKCPTLRPLMLNGRTTDERINRISDDSVQTVRLGRCTYMYIRYMNGPISISSDAGTRLVPSRAVSLSLMR